MASSEKIGVLQGTLDMLILKSLQAGPRHGYQITNWLELTSQKAFCIEEGSLYPALHRMERKGWIESEWGTSESNRKAKFYKLTKSGRLQLAHQVSAWDALSQAIGFIVHPSMRDPS